MNGHGLFVLEQAKVAVRGIEGETPSRLRDGVDPLLECVWHAGVPHGDVEHVGIRGGKLVEHGTCVFPCLDLLGCLVSAGENSHFGGGCGLAEVREGSGVEQIERFNVKALVGGVLDGGDEVAGQPQ